jgi:hypothetical protein
MVSSTLPVAVLCTGTTHAEGVDPLSFSIDGSASPNAVNGVGITYDVDDTTLAEWLAANPRMVDSVKAITQAELDALTQVQDQYGYELGLTPPGTLAAEGAPGLGRVIPDAPAQGRQEPAHEAGRQAHRAGRGDKSE